MTAEAYTSEFGFVGPNNIIALISATVKTPFPGVT
jgi:hypothetical protein